MKKILVGFLILMLIPAIAFCSTTKVLDQETELRPQGWAAGSLKFKGGSQVELNDRGEVISGVINKTYDLRPAGMAYVSLVGIMQGNVAPYHSWYIYYQGDSVTFDEHGWVLSGTLGNDVDAYLIPNVEPLIRFRKGNVIVFDKNRNLLKGTIDEDTFLCPIGWEKFLPNNGGMIKFKSGTEVIFGPNARVMTGTIAKDLTVNGKVYPAGTKMQFSEFAYSQQI